MGKICFHCGKQIKYAENNRIRIYLSVLYIMKYLTIAFSEEANKKSGIKTSLNVRLIPLCKLRLYLSAVKNHLRFPAICYR